MAKLPMGYKTYWGYPFDRRSGGYHDLIATQRPREVPPTPPQAHRHLPRLERPPANPPWRTAEVDASG